MSRSINKIIWKMLWKSEFSIAWDNIILMFGPAQLPRVVATSFPHFQKEVPELEAFSRDFAALVFETVLEKPMNQDIRNLLSSKSKSDEQRIVKRMKLSRNDLLQVLVHLHSENYEIEVHWVPFGKSTENIPLSLETEPTSEEDFVEKILESGSIFDKRVKSETNTLTAYSIHKDSKWYIIYFRDHDIEGKHSAVGPHLHFISHNWAVKRAPIWLRILENQRIRPTGHHIPYRRYSRPPKLDFRKVTQD